MSLTKTVVFISGTGTNLQALIDSVKSEVLPLDIQLVVSNNNECEGNERAKNNGIPLKIAEWNTDQKREHYDTVLSTFVREKYNPDLVILAGWDHILTDNFIQTFPWLINLHPALPKTFIGMNCIRKAYDAFKEGKCDKTGTMCHRVIKQLDAGEVLAYQTVPILQTDTYEDLEVRVKSYEKLVLVSGIQKCLNQINEERLTTDTQELNTPTYVGKARDVYDIGYERLLLHTTNRLSAFDKAICAVPCKGSMLTNMAAYWFDRTRDIIPNHYLWHKGPYTVVKKCNPIKVEIIVRGYLTGNSPTSIWTLYNKGEREFGGVTLSDGMTKHQKLDNVLITPTTKGETDEPLTLDELTTRGYFTTSQKNYVLSKARELFQYGQEHAKEMGLILVDTKYEFGFDEDNNIILIDELHTCDSSRFWLANNSLEVAFDENGEPQKIDKDVVRDYIKKNQTSIIPEEHIQKTKEAYLNYHNRLGLGSNIEEQDILMPILDIKKEYFEFHYTRKAVILAGSPKDHTHVNKIAQELSNVNVYCDIHYASAHKETHKVLGIMKRYESQQDLSLVWITCAGMSNALSGVVASQTRFPVIACPPYKDKDDMMVNIHSSVQCPSYVPVMFVMNPLNCALAVSKIL